MGEQGEGIDMPTAIRALRLQLFVHDQHGEPFRTADVAEYLGVSWYGAKSLLIAAQEFFGFYQDEDGLWHLSPDHWYSRQFSRNR